MFLFPQIDGQFNLSLSSLSLDLGQLQGQDWLTPFFLGEWMRVLC